MGASALLNLGASMLRLYPPVGVAAVGAALQNSTRLEGDALLKQVRQGTATVCAITSNPIWGRG